MALILNIDTATRNCSVALSKDNELISIRQTKVENSHSSMLTVFIEEILKENKIKPSDLDAIAVSMGPGSYTGLRIGVSTAKGLCYGISKPLISLNTLKIMAFGMIRKYNDSKTLYCPMIDARRMEIYTALFDSQLKEIEKTSALIIDSETFSSILKTNKVVFFGDGAAKCKDLYKDNSNAIFIDDFEISAEYMISLSNAKFFANEFENTIYFEPYYLKDFVGTTPKEILK